MSDTAIRLRDELGRLSVAERAEMAEYLLETLDPDLDAQFDDDPQFEEELARRGQEITSGTARGRSAADVMAELRKEYP